MTVLSLARLVAAILSAALLAASGYLLWSWYDGAWIRGPDDELLRVRETWRLWTGGGLLAWSFLGRFIAPLLLARGGGAPLNWPRHEGMMVQGASGSTLYVEKHGPRDAPLLLFTHGWGMDSSFWTLARQDLADRFRLVVWDLPGLGRSRAPGGEIALSNFAADLRGLLEGLDRPAVLVGHSIGGMTIQTLARDHPQALDRVAGIVLLNTTYTNPLRTMVLGSLLQSLQKPMLEPLARLTIWTQPLVWLSKWQSYLSGGTHVAMRLGFGRTATRRQLEHVARLATRAPPAIEAKGDLAMFHWDATGALERQRIPLLVIGGDVDIVTLPDASAEIASQAPGASLMVVPAANHMGPLECADLYNRAIAEFALSVQPGAGRRSPRKGDGARAAQGWGEPAQSHPPDKRPAETSP